MIYQYKIQTLTEPELGALLYICNELFGAKTKVDKKTVTAYKEQALYAKLRAAKDKIKPAHIEFYKIMCGKLGVDV